MSENAWDTPEALEAMEASATDASCVLYPGKYDVRLRQAFREGSTWAHKGRPRMTDAEALELADYDGETIVEVMREWGFIKPTEGPSA